MSFDSQKRLEYLLSIPNYVGNPTFTSRVGWAPENLATVLVDNAAGEVAICVLVGKVNSDRIASGPAGTFGGERTFGPLVKAKFQFTLSRPDDEIFSKEWDRVINTLERIQTKTSKSGTNQYFIIESTSIRFNHNIFVKRDTVSLLQLTYQSFDSSFIQ